MATKGERYRALRDFLAASFDRNDFDEFLKLNGYEDIASAVVREAADSKYFLDVVEAMDRRGLIDAAFFGLLKVQRPRKGAEIEGLKRAWHFEGRPRPTEDRKWATYSPVTSLRTLLGKHWKLLGTVLAGVPTLLVLLSWLGLPVSDWTGITANPASQAFLFGIGLAVLVVIRIPKVDSTVTLWIVPPPPLLPDQPRIFRGPLPYEAEDADRFYGRKADIETCWDRIRRKPFFILEGESGCGKSSLLSTALLPRAGGGFHVVECRCAEDHSASCAAPSSANATSGRVEPESLRWPRHSTPSTRPAADGSNTNLLVCIDQFEELFVTVKDTVRRSFFEALRDAIDRGQFRLVLGIRSDFSDLLWKACRDVDPDHRAFAFDRESYYTLRSFEAGRPSRCWTGCSTGPNSMKAAPSSASSSGTSPAPGPRSAPPPARPAPLQGGRGAGRARRAPDGRLDLRDDPRRQVLGGRPPPAGRQGGALSHLPRGRQGLRLPQDGRAGFDLAPDPASADQPVRDQVAAVGRRPHDPNLHLPVERVADVLGAFSERFLVRPLPGEDGGNGEPGVGSRRYELMHEHFVQLLAEAPEPENQRARDAEERLRFWKQRAHRLLTPQ